MPPSEDSREPNDLHQTLRLRSSAEDADSQLDQTINSQLYATLRNGDGDVSQLKLLIPDFEILEELGRGAFGVVYRARDIKLDRQVAIKVSLLDDPSRREQYIREARNAAKLDSAGIVPVYQVGTLSDGQPFVVQRLIEGNTLRGILANQGALDLVRTCKLMVAIAEAVAHAHAVGMIHRDLKPDNILVDAAGKPWVADFGLAILEEDQSQHRGERAGTPLYMSPEQLRGRTEWLDGRTDIYALGIMLYEMLTGRPPFDAQSLAELEEQVLHRDPKPISQRAPHMPAAMDIIFQNCCAKQVNDRYANAHELVADIQAVLAGITQVDMQALPAGRLAGGLESAQRPYAPLPVSARRKTMRQTNAGYTTQVQPAEDSWLQRNRSVMIALSLFAAAALSGVFVWGPWRKADLAATPQDSSSVASTLPLDRRPTDVSAIPSPVGPSPVGPSPVETPTAEATAAGNSPNATTQPTTQPRAEKIPQRPFRVSKGSDGTHTTIRAAIAMAEEGETITILPGNYVESLALDRNLQFVGQGNRDDIVIVGENQSAVTLTQNVAVTLNNLTLESLKTGDQDLNTLEVLAGSLELQNCTVSSRSFDCVKLHPGSGLSASDCRFRTTAHPAISGDRTSLLLLNKCQFDIRPPTLDTDSIPVGVQVSDSGGTIRGCSFLGSGAAVGVHWQASSQPVVIEDSTFENCESGVIVQTCDQVTIAGNDRVRFTGCQHGLLLDRSSANLSGLDVNGTSPEKGIRIVDTRPVPDVPSVTLSDCRVSGYGVSLSIERARVAVTGFSSSKSELAGVQLVAQSRLVLRSSSVSTSELNGLLIEDSAAEVTDCEFSDNVAGISVDSHLDALSILDCRFRDNTSGLLITSGTVKLTGGLFEDNLAGVTVMSHELLRQNAAGDPTPIFLDFNQVNFKNNSNGGLLVRAPCRFRIQEPSTGGNSTPLTPKIVGELKAAQVDDVTIVQPKAAGGQKL
jgi:serine/threonine protein kinase